MPLHRHRCRRGCCDATASERGSLAALLSAPYLPIVRSLLEHGDSPYRAFARLAACYGPLISLRLGRVTIVVASSPTEGDALEVEQGGVADAVEAAELEGADARAPT
uniref:Uncharacterized protein n=1 Tax=Ananas comosus var. bracteatus TaxID=296719 RepID=A0A6V7P956_ANACO|nr:unnamed protein product [Ananas comosus var. bracteatus]